MSMELKEVQTLMEKLKNDFTADVRQIVHKEINNLNLPALIEDQNKKYDELKKENKLLKETVAKQGKTIEILQRRNNVVIFGIPEDVDENFASLSLKILDIFNKVLVVEIGSNDLNYLRRLGPKTSVKRPTVVSFISNLKKMSVLRNSAKLKGSGVFISADFDKETLSQRKEIRSIQTHLRETGQNSKLAGNGLIIKGKYRPYVDLIKSVNPDKTERKCLSEGVSDEDPDVTFTKEDGKMKKRKRTKKSSPQAASSSLMQEFFRPRTSSTSSALSAKSVK